MGSRRELQAYVLFQIGLREPSACPLTEHSWIELLVQLKSVDTANVKRVRVEEQERPLAMFRPIVQLVVIMKKLDEQQSPVLDSPILFLDPSEVKIAEIMDSVVVDDNATAISSIATLGQTIWQNYAENSAYVNRTAGFGAITADNADVVALLKLLRFIYVNFKVWHMRDASKSIVREEKEPRVLTQPVDSVSSIVHLSNLTTQRKLGNLALPLVLSIVANVQLSGLHEIPMSIIFQVVELLNSDLLLADAFTTVVKALHKEYRNDIKFSNAAVSLIKKLKKPRGKKRKPE